MTPDEHRAAAQQAAAQALRYALASMVLAGIGAGLALVSILL